MLKRFFIFYVCLMSFIWADVAPFSQKSFLMDREEFNRGTYLIVLSNPQLNTIYMTNFVNLKKTQGFDVEVISFRQGNSDVDGINGSVNDDLKDYLIDYYAADSMLEYVLLVGDVNQNNDNYNIPTYEIPSYNENENDQTDYPYTFFDAGDGEDALSPHFFIGRWSIGSSTDLANIIKRNIQYATLNESFIPDPSYLNNGLVVAGNYSGEGTSPSNWPVTPVWTSKWLQEELFFHGYSQVDSAFFHKYNYDWATTPDQIEESWNNGVGIINYRGWGDARGWHKPQFRLDEIQDLLNPSFSLPVVFSFVCNTGDFGNEQQVFCFGETLLTAGTITAPKGAVAVIGPSDLDTDTRFNNVLCGAIWDELLEGRQSELAPGLHKGKQAVTKEFNGLQINGTDIPEFYHHVYGVLGDPSLSVWIKEPTRMSATLEEGQSLSNSYVLANITDNNTGQPLNDVVGALMNGNELVGKGISNSNGVLYIDFEDGVALGDDLVFYINKGQYYQESYDLNYSSENNHSPQINPAPEEEEEEDYGYEFEIIDYEWIEISETGTNLNLVDDSNTTIPLDFDFTYYGETFSEMTVCSNGWASFIRCLDGNTNDGQECDALSYFYNNSITAAIGPYAMLAPFYDDLDDNNGTEPLNIYSQWIEDESKFVIQWNNIANGHVDEYCVDNTVGDVNEDFVVNVQDMVMMIGIILGTYAPSESQLASADCNNDENIDVYDILFALSLSFDAVEDPEECVHETFQLILIPSDDNSDGEIIFQYKEIYNVDDHGATIGIESPDKNQGVEYMFNQAYSGEAVPLQNSLAIRFYIP